jgi:hypothetical protein
LQESKTESEREEEENEEEEKQAQVEKNKPFHAMLHLHTSTTGSCSAQSRLKAGCKAIGKARHNPTFPLPLEGQVLFPRVILSVEKCVVSSGRVGVVPMLGSAGGDFPTNRKRKKTTSGGSKPHKRERGGFGEEPPGPQCLASRFGRMPLWESSGFLAILTSSPVFPSR